MDLFLYFTDVRLTISGSKPYAVIDQPFTFTCSASDAVDLTDTILFRKATPQTWYGSLTQYLDGCREHSPPPGDDEVHCGSGTDKGSSSVKVYVLNIFKIRPAHITVWWCLMGLLPFARSYNYTLHLKSEYILKCWSFCVTYNKYE